MGSGGDPGVGFGVWEWVQGVWERSGGSGVGSRVGQGGQLGGVLQ